MSRPAVLDLLPAPVVERAADLDRRDPLAAAREEFVLPDGVVAYLDGNSLGRPLKVTRDRLARFVDEEWGERLIRSWDERWMDRPTAMGDAIGRVVLGAAPGQTVVGDSTTVMLYKLVRAAVDARPDRTEIVADTKNFPTDRFILTSVAAETGRTVRWIDPDPATGVEADEVAGLVGDRTALVMLSHVAYKSAYVADLPALTATAHRAGALVRWCSGTCPTPRARWTCSWMPRTSTWRSAAATNSWAADRARRRSATWPGGCRRSWCSPSPAGWGTPSRSRWAPATCPRPGCAGSSAARCRSSACCPWRTCSR